MVVEGWVLVVQWVLALFGLPEARGDPRRLGELRSGNDEGNTVRTTRETQRERRER